MMIKKKEPVKKIKSRLGSNLVVIARAGTGKTFTMVEGLHQLRGTSTFQGVPSKQQQEIWEVMKEGVTPLSILMCAFNRDIAEEIGRKVPYGCASSTIHALGSKAIRKAYGKIRMTKSWKTMNLLEKITGKDGRELRKDKPDIIMAVQKLVDMARYTLAGWDAETGFDPARITNGVIDRLAAMYDVEFDSEEVYTYVPAILEMGREIGDECREYDYTDMIWLPVVNKGEIRMPKYDMVVVDEAQDMNACQQELILEIGRRIIAVGDPCQAIYGFAGADTESIEHLIEKLTTRFWTKVKVKPLNATFRCGKRIVEVAQKIVPEYKAHKLNGPGKVRTITKEKLLLEAIAGDMIVCRVNAPLVGTAFRFIKAGKKATIRGKDIGKGLISLVNKMKARDVGDLMEKIDDYFHQESEKLSKRKRGNTDAQLIALQDKRDCIMVFCDGCLEISEVTASIEKMFVADTTEGVRLSSIHRAKGLESHRVYVLSPELLPHPMASTKWQREQENNLKYVAITRAIEDLVWVNE